MRSRRRFGLCLMLFVTLSALHVTRTASTSVAVQRGASGPYTITFEVLTAKAATGGDTKDQITIQFTNENSEGRAAPSPLFGQLVLQEFSFSGYDALPGRTFVFGRAVNDLSFLNASWIRVLNHGGDGWAGESLSISVRYPDGSLRTILKQQSLYPRGGYQRDGDIEKFNRAQWVERKYWESDLQRIRLDRRAQSK